MAKTFTREALEYDIPLCWKHATSADSEHWSSANPAWGQCDVTALVIHDHLGGDMVRTLFTTPDGKRGTHYFNILPCGTVCDLTQRQFPTGTKFMPALTQGAEAFKSATRIHLIKQGLSPDSGHSLRDSLLAALPTRLRYLRLASDVMRTPTQGHA